jgi:hypothetical protein
MFGRLRNPRGGYTLPAIGLALLLLAAYTGPGFLPGGPAALFPVTLALGGLACLWGGWRARRAARYDLGRLWDEPSPPPEEPRQDTVPEGEESAPYCGWCDEAYAPGTPRCLQCGRELG